MKKVIFLIMFLLFFINGCSVPLKQESAEPIFSHSISNVSLVDFKDRAFQFINEQFHSGKSVQQGETSTMIAGNGIIDLGSARLGLAEVYAEVTFIIKYENTSYKVKYVVKNFIWENSEGRKSIPNNQWGMWEEEYSTAISKLDGELFTYINGKSTF